MSKLSQHLRLGGDMNRNKQGAVGCQSDFDDEDPENPLNARFSVAAVVTGQHKMLLPRTYLSPATTTVLPLSSGYQHTSQESLF
jgi:hypothetical protein